MSLLLGAIADDFTGATDLANTLVQQGMRVIQTIGVPDRNIQLDNVDAVVIALKSRSEPAIEAVKVSLLALDWLQARQTRQFFFKYCSTFDSSADGNIGPVSDALMDALDCSFAFVCPAFPTNGRTIFQGNLFVGTDLLAESPMKDHPLTPMRDSSLLRLMAAQSRRQCGLIAFDSVQKGEEAIAQRIGELREAGISYAIVDAICDANLMTIGRAAANHSLITGGSGVALGLADNFRNAGLLGESALPETPKILGRELVLAGSCSQATRAQIDAIKTQWPHYRIDADALADGRINADDISDWASRQNAHQPVLIYASADPDQVAAVQQRCGREAAGKMIESLFAELASKLVAQGFCRIVVAGGETSGAVVSALGIQSLRIGAEIDPGVPWTTTDGATEIALALKSGNFGGVDFFAKAFRMLA